MEKFYNKLHDYLKGIIQLSAIVIGTGMPVPAFARPLAKNLMSVPEDLPKRKMPICLCLQNSQKYRAYHRALVKNPARKFPERAMPELPVPEKFEKGHAKNVCSHHYSLQAYLNLKKILL